jgi:ubiquinone/menaquinone biosynthesis C-methylase UbiE
MERVLEPELMDDAQRAQAYAGADFSKSNQLFVNQLLSDYPALSGIVVDLGTGPGDVVIRLARANPSVTITAVDGSDAMIRIAERMVQAQSLEQRITTLCARLPGLPLPESGFDAVLSKDLLHHLPDPSVLWQEVKRLARSGAVLYVMDLFRPASLAQVKDLVKQVTGDAHPLVQEDFFNSLCAAFTPEEVKAQVAAAGLPAVVERVSERHMVIRGRMPA